MFDDQTTSRWIPSNTLGLPVNDPSQRARRSTLERAQWLDRPEVGGAPAGESSSWELVADVARMQRVPLPLWLRALVPGMALFAATLFGSVMLFVQPTASRSTATPPPAAQPSVPAVARELPAATPAAAPSPAPEAAEDAHTPSRTAEAAAPGKSTKPSRKAADRAPVSRTAAAAVSEPATERAELGTLRLNSRPWSHVFVDGRRVGHTPILSLELPAGEHEVELVNETLDVRKTLRVNIRRDEVLTKVVLLVD